MIRTAFLLLAACTAHAQDTIDHHAAVNARGDEHMGFSHDKTTHHFRLYRDGGAIEVTANDPKDIPSREEIQMHLTHIATMFATGDFNIPMLIHDQTPPGVPTMQKLKSTIKYRSEKTSTGGRVRIVTANPDALAAIHQFLRFQITDHQTGDPLTITTR